MSAGLGLGLFIAREMVGAHGGTIEVRSTEGEGTTFVIRLPLLDSQEADGGGMPGDAETAPGGDG